MKVGVKMKLTNLNDTIPMMQSEDYKERFKAELHQVGIRIEKLSNMVEKYEKGQLNFCHKCPLALLKAQLCSMKQYLMILYEIAEMENIIIDK